MCEWFPEEITLLKADGTRRIIRGESTELGEVFTHQYGDEDVRRYVVDRQPGPHQWEATEVRA